MKFKKILMLVFLSILTFIITITSTFNVSKAELPDVNDFYRWFYITPITSLPVDEEFWEQNNFTFGYPSNDTSYYPITDYLLLDNGNYIALMAMRYTYGVNQQTGFHDVYMTLYFRYRTPDNSSYNIVYIRYKYIRGDLQVRTDYVSGAWATVWGEDFEFTFPDYRWYQGYRYSELLLSSNLTDDQLDILGRYFTLQPLLNSPVLTLDFATLDWQPVANATSYKIYKDNEYYITVTDSQFVTIANGSYYVVAVDSTGSYGDSSQSNTINVTAYNDDVGNGTNFFSLFSAIIDAQLHLFRSMLDWNILGINLLTLFKIILTIFLIVLVIKFILGKK